MKRWQKYGRQSLLAAALLYGSAAHALIELDVQDSGVVDLLLTGTSEANTFAVKFSSGMATGDFNGDGITDLAVGMPEETSFRGLATAGRVLMFRGGARLRDWTSPVAPADSRQTYTLAGSLADEKLGSRMTAGDFNGDGFDDLVMYAEHPGQGEDGPRLYVLYGKADFAAQMETGRHTDTIITHGHAAAVSSNWNSMEVLNLAAGDVNGDGIDDLVIGDGVNNRFYVLAGSGDKWAPALDLSTANSGALRAPEADDPWAVGLSNNATGLAVGDLNGDGIADIAMGASEESVGSLEKAGRVYVVYGKNPFPASVELADNADVIIDGGMNKEEIGGALAIGDFNANGRGDLLIGAPRSGLGQVGTTGIGRAFVVYDVGGRGASLDLFFDADITLTLNQDVRRIGFHTGWQVSAADVNGDGIADMTVTAPNAFFSSSQNGWVHTVYGGSGLQAEYDLNEQADLAIYTPAPPKPMCCGEMGTSLAIADLDNDAKPDLILGAPTGGQGSAGWAAILFDAANKGPGGTQGAVARLDLQTMGLSLPVINLNVPGIPAVYANLALVDPLNLVFELREFNFTEQTSDKAASFNGDNGRLHIPALDVGGTLYQVDLTLNSVEPLRFAVDLGSLGPAR